MTNKPMLSVDREHRLKIHRKPFLDLESGGKTCEIRDCSDRDFQVGDSVLLMLVDETGNPTPNELLRKITHIQTGYGLPDDLCVLSYEPAAQHQVDPVMPGSEEFSHMSTIELRGYHAGWCAACIQNRSAEKPAPVAPFKPDTVVCRRYTLEGQNFYHYDLEPVYGSVPVTVSELINEAPIAVVMPERMKESRAYGHDLGGNYDEGKADGYNAALDEVARLNGVKS